MSPRLLRTSRTPLVALALLAIALALAQPNPAAHAASPQKKPLADAPSTRAFADSTRHWRHINEPERVIQPLPDQLSFTPEQVREITANILLFQRTNGGWPKDYDMLACLTQEQRAAIAASRDRADTTFDNHTTHTQTAYLAHAYRILHEEAIREACLRGLDFILAAQYPEGGFPQRWPSPKGLHAHITFNDGVMIGNLTVLRDAANRQNGFEWLDPQHRDRAGDAVARGTACLLALQYRNATGTRSGWAQQHDPHTLQPTSARTFELPSLAPEETTEITRFLMASPEPSSEIRESIAAAIAWLAKVKLDAIRIEKYEAPPAEFYRHRTTTDVRVVHDPHAPPLWARMYELETDRPIFASRDGIKVYSLAEVDRERRTGSVWYGTWPANLLNKEYPKWLKQQSPHEH